MSIIDVFDGRPQNKDQEATIAAKDYCDKLSDYYELYRPTLSSLKYQIMVCKCKQKTSQSERIASRVYFNEEV